MNNVVIGDGVIAWSTSTYAANGYSNPRSIFYAVGLANGGTVWNFKVLGSGKGFAGLKIVNGTSVEYRTVDMKRPAIIRFDRARNEWGSR